MHLTMRNVFSPIVNDKPKYLKWVVTNVILFTDSCHTCDPAAGQTQRPAHALVFK